MALTARCVSFWTPTRFKFSPLFCSAHTMDGTLIRTNATTQAAENMIQLPAWPYAQDALKPYISAETLSYHYGAPGANTARPVRHFKGRQADGGHACNKHAFRTMNQLHLLLKSELAQPRLHPAIDLFRRFLLPCVWTGTSNSPSKATNKATRKIRTRFDSVRRTIDTSPPIRT